MTTELNAQKLAGKILNLSDQQLRIKKQCYRKLQNRWEWYQKKGIDYERAKRRYTNYKLWLEEEYKVTLGV